MKKVANVLGFGAAKQKAPVIKMPEPEAPAPIPDQDVIERNAARAQARRRSTGRAATLLADDGEGNLG
jgi:hypothetical protein